MAQESTSPFKLNIPISLKNRLSEAAERSGRSLTAEMIIRLEKTLAAPDEMENMLEIVDQLLVRIDDLERTVEDLSAEVFPQRHMQG